MPDHDVSVIGFSAGGVGALARLAAATDAPASEEEQPGWAGRTSAGGPA